MVEAMAVVPTAGARGLPDELPAGDEVSFFTHRPHRLDAELGGRCDQMPPRCGHVRGSCAEEPDGKRGDVVDEVRPKARSTYCRPAAAC